MYVYMYTCMYIFVCTYTTYLCIHIFTYTDDETERTFVVVQLFMHAYDKWFLYIYFWWGIPVYVYTKICCVYMYKDVYFYMYWK